MVKLWLPDAELAERILSAAWEKGARNRSLSAYEKALKISPSFVRTDAYGRALEILDLTHVVVISGEAGAEGAVENGCADACMHLITEDHAAGDLDRGEEGDHRSEFYDRY